MNRGKGVRYRVSGIRYQVSGIRYQVSGAGYRVCYRSVKGSPGKPVSVQVSGTRHTPLLPG